LTSADPAAAGVEDLVKPLGSIVAIGPPRRTLAIRLQAD
jgi:hypothetical protein